MRSFAEMHDAETARREGRYDEAIAAFERIDPAGFDADCGWRIAFCLRRSGRLAEAAARARCAVALCATSLMARSEWFWALRALALEGKAAGALPEGFPLHDFLENASSLLDLQDDPTSRQLVVFGVLDVARLAGLSEDALSWTERLDPSALSTAPRLVAGKRGLSDAERWYYARLRALRETGRTADARRVALEAHERFPRRIDFLRAAASALADEGREHEALAEVAEATRDPRAPWYLLADAARWALASNRADDAFRLACRAALGCRELPPGVRLFESLASIAVARSETALARDHLRLALAIRAEQGWPVPDPVVKLAGELGVASDGVESPADLANRLRPVWRSGAIDAEARSTGRIERIHANGLSGHIRADDGTSIFVVLRDVPPDLRDVGTRVAFEVVSSFDRKRNRESERAVRVGPADAGTSGVERSSA